MKEINSKLIKCCIAPVLVASKVKELDLNPCVYL